MKLKPTSALAKRIAANQLVAAERRAQEDAVRAAARAARDADPQVIAARAAFNNDMIAFREALANEYYTKWYARKTAAEAAAVRAERNLRGV